MKTEIVLFGGGIDKVTPPISLKPGMLIDALNFEPDINGGYRRMYGYERFDGRPRPSDADYYVMTVTITGTINVGDTVTGDSSAATAVVIKVNGTTELIVTKVTGTFTVENLEVAATPQASLTATSIDGATTPILHATYKNLAADEYRDDIGSVPGNGAVRGVWYYNGTVYAFRDDGGPPATSCKMYKSTTSGWTQVSLGYEVQYTAGAVAEPVDGETLTQGGVTATVRRVLTRTGAWSGTAAGTFVISAPAGGNFAAGAATLSGTGTVTLSGAESAITLQPGGKYQFVTTNFFGSAITQRMYGCDGVNLAFEFDGTYYVPIRTGTSTDTPKYIAAFKNQLLLAIGSSVMVSAVGDPYNWSAITGAGEIALGATCTGMLPQIGNASAGSLMIGTDAPTTFVLYGNDTSDFSLTVSAPEAGPRPYTLQNMGAAYYLDTKGVVSIETTQKFGNFEASTISRAVQTLIDQKRGTETTSCFVRASNQYRLFFSDGTGLIFNTIGMPSAVVMYFDYGNSMYINNTCSVIDTSGVERIFAASSDGYVYELERGTSFDGAIIPARLLTVFNTSGSPRQRKHYIRTSLQGQVTNTAQLQVGYDLSYGDYDTLPGVGYEYTALGGGGWWDQFIWDQFNWDAPYVVETTLDTPGNGRSFSLLVLNETDMDEPFTIVSSIHHYELRRSER